MPADGLLHMLEVGQCEYLGAMKIDIRESNPKSSLRMSRVMKKRDQTRLIDFHVRNHGRGGQDITRKYSDHFSASSLVSL